MTKEIAIHNLYALKQRTRASSDHEALDMAIQALEQQPCEDYISRQVVKDMLNAEWTKYMPMELDINLSFVLDKISTLPSVTPSYNSVKTELKPCEDAISRAEAIEGLGEQPYNWTDSEGEIQECHDWLETKKMLESLPSVTPTRPHGEWIYVQYDGNKNIGNWHCSNCRQICIAMHSMDDAFDFCPNCGADMRKVQDEDSD